MVCRSRRRRSSPSGSKSRTTTIAPTTCCRRAWIRISSRLRKRPKRSRRTMRARRRASSIGVSAQLAFHNPVLPGTTTSGFVLTNLDEGGKLVQIDLVASGRAKTFSILTIVPGFRARLPRQWRLQARDPSPDGEIVDVHRRRRLPAGTRAAALLRHQQGRLEERRSPQSGRRGRPRRCAAGTRAARLASDRAEVVGLDHEDDDVCDLGRSLCLCAGERSLPLRSRPGLRAAEGARQHPPAQSPAAVAEPRCATGASRCGWGRSAATSAAGSRSIRRRSPRTRSTRTWMKRAARWPRTWRTRRGWRRSAMPRASASRHATAPRQNLTTDPYYTDGRRLVLVFDRAPDVAGGNRVLRMTCSKAPPQGGTP